MSQFHVAFIIVYSQQSERNHSPNSYLYLVLSSSAQDGGSRRQGEERVSLTEIEEGGKRSGRERKRGGEGQRERLRLVKLRVHISPTLLYLSLSTLS